MKEKKIQNICSKEKQELFNMMRLNYVGLYKVAMTHTGCPEFQERVVESHRLLFRLYYSVNKNVYQIIDFGFSEFGMTSCL